MMDHQMQTRYAELVRCEALRYRGLSQLPGTDPAYGELYLALAFAAMCVDKEMSDENRR